MKKGIAFILLFVILCCTFASCGNKNASMYSIDSYDNESHFLPPEESETENSDENQGSPTDNGFLVKDKKYSFEGNDLVILSIENQSEKAYSVTVTGTYHDENGNAIKSETQTFDQYYPTFCNYHLFKPDFSFASFTYSLSFEEYSGELYAKRLSFSFNGLKEKNFPILDPNEREEGRILYPTILMEMSFELSGKEELKPNGYCILFDENDKIIVIHSIGGLMPAGQTSTKSAIVYQTTDEKLTWPEELKGNLKALYVLTDIGPMV